MPESLFESRFESDVGAFVGALVGALREQSDQNHQVGKRKKPLIRMDPGGFRGASDESQVAGLCEVVDVLDANPRQVGNFGISENLLAGLHGNHGLAPRKLNPTSFYFLLTHSYELRRCIHPICFDELRAIVVPFRKQKTFRLVLFP